MKVKRIIFSLLPAAWVLLLPAACQREVEAPETFAAGTDITFSASVEIPSETRAYYTYAFAGDEGKEGIQMEVKDRFYVYSPQASRGENHMADYHIDELATVNGESLGHAITDYPLQWTEGEHTFYSLYGGDNIQYYASMSENVATIQLPSDVNCSVDGRKYRMISQNTFLYAVTHSLPTDKPVPMTFKPLTTVIRFALYNYADDPTYSSLTHVILRSTQSGAFLSGKMKVTLNEDGSFTPGEVTDGGNEMKMGCGLKLRTDEPLILTFLTLPVDQTDLELELVFNNGLKRNLSLTEGGTPVTVPAGHMAFFDNLAVPDATAYILGITNPGDLEYDGRVSRGGGIQSYTERSNVKTPAPWHIEGYYADEDCTIPYDGVDAADLPDWFVGITSSGTGAISGKESITINYTENRSCSETIVDDVVEKANEVIGGRPVGGTWEHWNLTRLASGRDPYHIYETANSYIVNKAGYYHLPLVMGNGIVGGVYNPNPKAYQGGDGQHETRFRDYKGQLIENPILDRSNTVEGFTPKSPATAFVVWEDVDGLIEVEPDSDYSLPATRLFERFEVYISGRATFIPGLHIHVAKAQQGNAVIAVADEDGEIMWSWHIWVTDYVPRTHSGYYTSADRDILVSSLDGVHEYEMMPRNLGWVTTSGTRTSYIYPARTVYLKICQDNGHIERVMKVTQPQATITSYADLHGYNPFFQWGRKDAFHPGNGEDASEPTFYGRYPTPSWDTSEPGLDVLTRSPWVMYSLGQGSSMFNLWNAGRDWSSSGYYTTDYYPVVKTIYDPCPPGYVLPPSGIYTSFTTTGLYSTNYSEFNVADVDEDGVITASDWRNGWNFRTNNSRAGSIYFPHTLYRYMSSLTGDTRSLYWSASPSNVNVAMGLYFDQSLISPWLGAPSLERSSAASIRPVANK